MPDAERLRQDAVLRERIRDHCRVPEGDAVRVQLTELQAQVAALAEQIASLHRTGGEDSP